MATKQTLLTSFFKPLIKSPSVDQGPVPKRTAQTIPPQSIPSNILPNQTKSASNPPSKQNTQSTNQTAFQNSPSKRSKKHHIVRDDDDDSSTSSQVETTDITRNSISKVEHKAGEESIPIPQDMTVKSHSPEADPQTQSDSSSLLVHPLPQKSFWKASSRLPGANRGRICSRRVQRR